MELANLPTGIEFPGFDEVNVGRVRGLVCVPTRIRWNSLACLKTGDSPQRRLENTFTRRHGRHLRRRQGLLMQARRVHFLFVLFTASSMSPTAFCTLPSTCL